ncbi:MAG: flagellar biosynthetic protein FliR [Acetobacteraceae bacterium]|jgi:flagellar biosynthetic protein FliR
MIAIDLSGWLTLEVYCTLLVFSRISAAFLLLPGFGEVAVPARMRVLAGLAIAVAVAGAVPGLPVSVPDAWGTLFAVAGEAFSGALLGTLARTIVSGILIAGQVIGQNIGIGNVFAQGVAIDQAASLGAMLYAGMIAIMFASGGHHVILRALVESYSVLPPAGFPNVAASTRAVVEAGLRCFRAGAQLAFPFLLLAFVFNVTLAVVNKALPAMPVFMIAAPALVVTGLYLLVAAVPGILEVGLSGWYDLPSLLR